MKYSFLLAFSACGVQPAEQKLPDPPFSADYAATYTEVRNCRPSIEHGAVHIRVLSAPNALDNYLHHTGPFATGDLLLKEEYAEADDTCTGTIRAWTVMLKLADGSAPETIDWTWQKVNGQRVTTSNNDETCISCHTMCGSSTDGYLHTCTDP